MYLWKDNIKDLCSEDQVCTCALQSCASVTCSPYGPAMAPPCGHMCAHVNVIRCMCVCMNRKKGKKSAWHKCMHALETLHVPNLRLIGRTSNDAVSCLFHSRDLPPPWVFDASVCSSCNAFLSGI